MKKLNLILIGILILAFILASCSGIIPSPVNHDKEIILVVNDYLLALSNKEYELAKTYCVLNGDAYKFVEQYQSMPYIGSFTLVFTAYLNDIEYINMNNAKVNIDLTITATVCIDDICSSSSETLKNYTMFLIKTPGNWKLK